MIMVTRRLELIDRLVKMCKLIGAAEFLMMILGRDVAKHFDTLIVPDHGHVFTIPVRYLDANTEVDFGKLRSFLPLSDSDLQLYSEAIEMITYEVYETILNAIFYNAEEYAIFGTIARQEPSKSVLTDSILALACKSSNDMTIVESLEESLLETISTSDISEAFNFYQFYENLVSSAFIMVKYPIVEDLLYDIMTEEAILRRDLGAKGLTANNSYFSHDGTLQVYEPIATLNAFKGDEAKEQIKSFTEDYFGIDLRQNIDGFINGVYYEGRYKLTDDQVSQVTEFLFNEC